MFKLSIVTIHYHCEEVLQQLLDSAVSLGPLPEAEWIIIDHSPARPPLDKRLKFPANIGSIRVIENAENKGFGSGCNLGAKNSSGNIIFFLNPDCCFQGGHISTIIDNLQRDGCIGALNPKMITPQGVFEFSFAAFPGLCSEARVKLEKRLSAAFPVIRRILERRFDGKRWVDWVTGGAMFVRREAFFKVGGFDEGYFIYFEDADLCRRLHLAGFKVGFDPSLTLLHNHGHGGSTKVPGGKSTVYRQSQIRYYEKHKNPLLRILLAIYLKLSGKYPK